MQVRSEISFAAFVEQLEIVQVMVAAAGGLAFQMNNPAFGGDIDLFAQIMQPAAQLNILTAVLVAFIKPAGGHKQIFGDKQGRAGNGLQTARRLHRRVRGRKIGIQMLGGEAWIKGYAQVLDAVAFRIKQERPHRAEAVRIVQGGKKRGGPVGGQQGIVVQKKQIRRLGRAGSQVAGAGKTQIALLAQQVKIIAEQAFAQGAKLCGG